MRLRTVLWTVSFLSGALAADPAGAPAFRFRASTHSEGTASAAISKADVEVLGWVKGEKSRIEIQKSRNPLLPKGAVLLSPDGGKTFTLIDPARKTSSPWSPPERAASKSAAASVVRVRFENPEVQKLAEAPGKKVAGLATRYFKFRIAYVSEVDILGTARKTATTRVEELWTAPTLTDAGFASWLRKDSAPTGNEAFDKQIAAELASAAGTPLERATTTTWKDADGVDQRVRTTLSVSELRKASEPPGLFELPPALRRDPAEKH